MIRRQPAMRFLGGYYAFPGGKVDGADAEAAILSRCQGVSLEEAERILPGADGMPALAYWVAAARELLEETGVLPACDGEGRPVALVDPEALLTIEEVRRDLMAGRGSLGALLERPGWHLDLSGFRYLSHYITPRSSPIRFSARFFLAPLPPGQSPTLFTEETSEGFWIAPAEGHKRFTSGDMPMAEPAEAGLAYLSEFPSLAALWDAHEDRRHKFHGILDRLR
jgi:8-oxo-dGTP pyrophosphatase MutT (NUDIX family)